MQRHRLLTIFAVVFVNMLGFGLILPLLPFYAETFNASGTVVGLLVASYAAGQMIGAPVLGRISDRVGRRPILLVSLGVLPRLRAGHQPSHRRSIIRSCWRLGTGYVRRRADELAGVADVATVSLHYIALPGRSRARRIASLMVRSRHPYPGPLLCAAWLWAANMSP